MTMALLTDTFTDIGSATHRAPPSPRVYDFPTLLDLGHTSQVLFRVTDPTSSSPLYWTGRQATSGFSSPNLNLAHLTPEVYAPIFTPGAGAINIDADAPYLRHTVLDHVLGKEKQTCLPTLTSIDERPDTPEDEKTPWVSTSVDLRWVMYEVCRRLVYLKRQSVWVTVIALPLPGQNRDRPVLKGSGEHEGNGPQIPSGSGAEANRVEVVVNPASILRITHAKARDLMLSVGMKENYDLAQKASETSSERLVWGRVFAGSILHHTEFTLGVRR